MMEIKEAKYSIFTWHNFFALVGIIIVIVPALPKLITSVIENKTTVQKMDSLHYIKKIDFKKLYGRWIPVSTHTNGDTNILSFLEDTVQSSYRIQYFDSGSYWHELDGDIGWEGTYKIDRVTCRLLIFNKSQKVADTIYNARVIYLDNKYMLTQPGNNRKSTEFFMRTEKKRFSMGG